MLRAKEESEMRMREDFDLKLKLLEKDKEESERRYREEAELCMKEALMDVRYEEERQRELRRTLEGEAADLRAMLVAMEQSSTDSELRHTASIRELSKVKQISRILILGNLSALHIRLVNLEMPGEDVALLCGENPLKCVGIPDHGHTEL